MSSGIDVAKYTSYIEENILVPVYLKEKHEVLPRGMTTCAINLTIFRMMDGFVIGINCSTGRNAIISFAFSANDCNKMRLGFKISADKDDVVIYVPYEEFRSKKLLTNCICTMCRILPEEVVDAAIDTNSFASVYSYFDSMKTYLDYISSK